MGKDIVGLLMPVANGSDGRGSGGGWQIHDWTREITRRTKALIRSGGGQGGGRTRVLEDGRRIRRRMMKNGEKSKLYNSA